MQLNSVKMYIKVFSFFLTAMDMASAMNPELHNQLRRLQEISNQISSPGTKNSDHTGIIPLPEDLKGKPIIHWSCDCQDLEGHYCGSYALSHAVEINKRLGLIKSTFKPNKIVKDAIIKEGIALDKASLTWTENIKKAATALNLKHAFISTNELGAFMLLGQNISTNPLSHHRETYEYINNMRANMAIDKTAQAHHFFVCFDVHVALVSVFRDEDEFAIEVCDNLNNPLKPGTKLHKYVSYIYDIYFPSIEKVYTKLFTKLEPNDYQKYLAKTNRKQITNFLVEKWLLAEREKSSNSIWNAAELNEVMKLLKELNSLGANDILKDAIISTYNAMVDLAELSSAKSNAEKSIYAEKICAAIKKSSDDKIFELQKDENAMLLYEKAQRVRNSLR